MKLAFYILLPFLVLTASADEASPVDKAPRELRIYYTGPTRGFLESCD